MFCAWPTLPSATRALGGEAADALPSGLVATTCTRRRLPRSARLGRYVAALAPAMLAQPRPRWRCQR
jgi:hypothetical protein